MLVANIAVPARARVVWNFPPSVPVSFLANSFWGASSIDAEGVKAMKSQAWGWLTAAVLAAGLNSSYQNGGLQWAHEIVGSLQHNTSAVLALATGRADQFLAEARIIQAHHTSSCPLSAAMAQVEQSFAPMHTEQQQFEMMSAREEEAMARLAARRARMEAQFARLNMANFNPVAVQAPRVVCPRVRVNLPRLPRVKMPVVQIPSAPAVHIDYSGSGPV